MNSVSASVIQQTSIPRRGSMSSAASDGSLDPWGRQGAQTVPATTATNQAQMHPNLFVRGIPLYWTEEQLVEIFAKFGELSSLRLVKHSVRKNSLGYGFVRYQHARDASIAINRLNGMTVDGQVLQVKLADSDAGPPTSSSVSGLHPCETLYVKHVPLSFSKQSLELLFGKYGEVMDVRVFPCLDQFRGSSALVKMDSVANARLAIQHIHGLKPQGWLHNIIVRFAESEAEKKLRLAKKEAMKADVSSHSSGEIACGTTFLAPSTKHASEVNSVLVSSSGNSRVLQTTVEDGVRQPRPTSLLQEGRSAVVEVTNMPLTADRLWIYEIFACFGAIQSVTLDQWSGKARIHFLDLLGGFRAVLELNGRQGMLVKLCTS
mmetsp:Transcript_1508/g.4941  ORF Transcript_1508/g.4941 Transcript_1508/m.4941 type:complete len:376 (+) Transcript_1508:3771-4898(+)